MSLVICTFAIANCEESIIWSIAFCIPTCSNSLLLSCKILKTQFDDLVSRTKAECEMCTSLSLTELCIQMNNNKHDNQNDVINHKLKRPI